MQNKRLITIFLITFTLSLSAIVIFSAIHQQRLHNWQQRVKLETARETDGAPNLIDLNGKWELLAFDGTRMRSQADGSIEIKGKAHLSIEKSVGTVLLMPGSYTFSGFEGVEDHSVLLVLRYSDRDESAKGTKPFSTVGWDNSSSSFEVEKETSFSVNIFVRQGTTLDLMMKPAIYKNGN